MAEHEKHCVNRCPACGAGQHEGYMDIDFGGNEECGTFVFARFRCPSCKLEYVEKYAYDATWYEAEEA